MSDAGGRPLGEGRQRGDSGWLIAVMCPVLTGLLIPIFNLFWWGATEAKKTGKDPVAPEGAEPVDATKVVKSVSSELVNALIVFAIAASAIVVALGFAALKLPGSPSWPINVAIVIAGLLITSLLGWIVVEQVKGYPFSTSYGTSGVALAKILVPHAVLGWVLFVVLMVAAYRP